jgi:hypothetical protein
MDASVCVLTLRRHHVNTPKHYWYKQLYKAVIYAYEASESTFQGHQAYFLLVGLLENVGAQSCGPAC